MSDLPVEILHTIFRRCLGWHVMPCRLVCRHWRDAVDCMSDRDWKAVCTNHSSLSEYEYVRNKYNLNWRETYRAVNSWSYWKIRRARFTATELCHQVDGFKVLPKGIVACLQTTGKDHAAYSNTIVYYDSITKKEIRREHFNFYFLTDNYEETEDFWLFILKSGQLCIMFKDNRRLRYNLGTLLKTDNDLNLVSLFKVLFCRRKAHVELNLIGQDIYFRNCDDNMIYRSKVTKLENGKKTVTTEQLSQVEFTHRIVEFSLKHKKLHILTDKADVYVCVDGKFQLTGYVDLDSDSAFDDLEVYGFNWKSQNVFDWATSIDGDYINSFASHSVVTVVALGYKVCIYFSAYSPENVKFLRYELEDTPTRMIDMDEAFDEILEETYSNTHFSNPFYPINHVDIIETGLYHSIVVSGYGTVFVLELEDRKRKMKRCNKPLIIKKAVARRKAKATVVTKHKYFTRSAKKKK